MERYEVIVANSLGTGRTLALLVHLFEACALCRIACRYRDLCGEIALGWRPTHTDPAAQSAVPVYTARAGVYPASDGPQPP